MTWKAIIWDLDDDPDGNVMHCARHGVTKEEVEEAMQNVIDTDVSRTTRRPLVFGMTRSKRHILVVYEETREGIYPITAYEVPRKRGR